MSKPRIILDKSTLYAISTSQMDILSKSFVVLIPIILIQELVTQLNKPVTDAKQKLMHLATRLTLGQSILIPTVNELVVYELLNGPLELPSKYDFFETPLIVKGNNEKQGCVEKSFSWRKILKRWSKVKFLPIDYEDALAIKKNIAEWNDKMNKAKEQEIKHIPLVNNLHEIIEYHNNLMREKLQHKRVITTLMDNYLPKFSREAIQRWKQNGYLDLKEYAPYCYYLDKAAFVVNIGLQTKLINRSKKNKTFVDSSYLPYLPFCDVFATGDNQQYFIAKNLIKPDQKVMHTNELKQTLLIEKTHIIYL